MVGGGSRNTGDYTLCCLNNAYHGCPSPLPKAEPQKTKERKAMGWRFV